MSDDKSPYNHSLYDELPEPLKSLAKCGKVFGVQINKKPEFPKKWSDKRLLKKFNDAVELRDQLIEEGKNAGLYMVMTDTCYRLFDFDADKDTNKLRPKQLEAIDYLQKQGHSLMESSSGVGRHIIVKDKDKQLPKVGPELVKAGKVPFEVKHDLVFLTCKILSNNQPPQPIDDASLKKIRTIKGLETSPRSATTTNPNKVFRLNKADQEEALEKLRDAIKYCKDNNITDVIHDESTFSEFVMGAKQFKQPFDEQYYFCDSQDGDKTNIRQRIESTNEPKTDRRAALFKLFKNKGWKEKQIPNNNKTQPTPTIQLHLADGQVQNIKIALDKLGFKFRYHELKGDQVMFPDSDKWEDLNDDKEAKINVNWLANLEKVGILARNNKNVAFNTPMTVRREVLLSILN